MPRNEDRCRRTLLTPRMTELAFARLRTIVRLGEAVPDIPITCAVDFILPVNCRRSTTCRSSSVGYRRQLTGKMKSTALGKNTFGTALPRRTIVTLTAFSRCVILGRWKMLSTPYPL